MSQERILDFVGAGDEEVAHLRLLMRRAASKLKDRWRLRSEADEKPDLLLVEPASIVGSGALMQAQQSGTPCVVVSSEAPAPGSVGTLLKPFKLDAVVEMLNGLEAVNLAATVPIAVPMEADVFGDFFVPRLVSDAPIEIPTDFDIEIPVRQFQADSAFEEAEALFKRDLNAERQEALRKLQLGDDVGLEASEGYSERSSMLRDSGIRVSSSEPISAILKHAGEASEEFGKETYLLDAYLKGNLLSGPARLSMANLLPLVLDPKGKLFYARGSLCVFEGHCVKPTRIADWKLLSAQEFADVRTQSPGRAYTELLWLSVYLGSHGKLSAAIDGSGAFRLRRSFEMSRDYPVAGRLAQLLQRGMRPSDLASDGRCPMSDVYNVLNAFDAIGYLERA